jgi:hypothetical protein
MGGRLGSALSLTAHRLPRGLLRARARRRKSRGLVDFWGGNEIWQVREARFLAQEDRKSDHAAPEACHAKCMFESCLHTLSFDIDSPQELSDISSAHRWQQKRSLMMEQCDGT